MKDSENIPTLSLGERYKYEHCGNMYAATLFSGGLEETDFGIRTIKLELIYVTLLEDEDV